MVISDTRMQIAPAPGKTTPSMMLTVEILGRNERQEEGEREKGRKGGEIKKKKGASALDSCKREARKRKRGEGPVCGGIGSAVAAFPSFIPFQCTVLHK